MNNEQYSVKHRSSVEWQSLPSSGGRKGSCKDAIYRVSVKLRELCASVLKRETFLFNTETRSRRFATGVSPVRRSVLATSQKCRPCGTYICGSISTAGYAAASPTVNQMSSLRDFKPLNLKPLNLKLLNLKLLNFKLLNSETFKCTRYSLLTTLTALLLFTATSLFAQGGTEGALTWKLDNGVFTLTGDGEMDDYNDWSNAAPWYEHQKYIHTVVINDGVTNIGTYAFAGCVNLVWLTIPSSVTIIGWGAFSGCRNLASITIPNGVKTIYNEAFDGCKNLTSITILNPVPVKISDDVFQSVNLNECTLKVPADAVSVYRKADVWKEFKRITNYELGITN